MTRIFATTALLTIALSAAAQADEIVNDDLIVTGNICAGGSACSDGETFGATDILIKGTIPELQFQDTTPGDTTWTMSVDDTSSGVDDGFSIKNETSSSFPFVIDELAPSNSLFIADDGDIGLGTMMPLADLHIAGGTTAKITLEDTVGPTYSWDIAANQINYFVFDGRALTYPFFIESGAPTYAVAIAENGNIGLGTGTPDAPLEISDENTFSFFRITAEDATVNQSVDIVFTEGPLGTGQLRYNIVDGDNQEMSLDADGNMILDGTITTAGSCSVGCDAVFDPGYDLPSIADHHARTLALGHLPNVGPTREDMPVDLADKQGRILNELEHAHLFIARQQEELASVRQLAMEQSRRIDALTARLDRIEAR